MKSSIDDPEAADYVLDIRLINVRAPQQGFDMTAAATSRWKLTEVRGEERVFEEIFTTPHSVSMGEAFVGSTRVRLAMEGALRESIRTGINWLSELDL
jgi:hypothetical protein